MRNKNLPHYKVQHKNKMLRNLTTSLILYEKIKTTNAKAKKVKKLVEKMINYGKKNNNPSIKKMYQFFLDKNAVKKIREDLTVKFKDRKSGFVRITRLGYRTGDAAPISQIELILPHIEKKIERTEVGKTKVTTKVRVKGQGADSKLSEVKPRSQSGERGIMSRRLDGKEKIKEEKNIPKTPDQGKKGWLNNTSFGKRITNATKKIWTKRTTSK